MNSAEHCRLCKDKDGSAFLIAIRHSVKVVESSSLRVNHLIRFSFFSIKKFTFSLVPTYFVRVCHFNRCTFCSVCDDFLYASKVDQIAIGEV